MDIQCLCRLLQEGRGLLETVSASGKTPAVKAAAADALAVLTFVGSEHPSDTLEVVQRLQSLWKGAAPVRHHGCILQRVLHPWIKKFSGTHALSLVHVPKSQSCSFSGGRRGL